MLKTGHLYNKAVSDTEQLTKTGFYFLPCQPYTTHGDMCYGPVSVRQKAVVCSNG